MGTHKFTAGGNPAIDKHLIQGGGGDRNTSSWDKLQPELMGHYRLECRLKLLPYRHLRIFTSTVAPRLSMLDTNTYSLPSSMNF